MGVLKLTDWFPGDVKPVRVGVYETSSNAGACFQHWNGKYWGRASNTPDQAASKASDRSVFQEDSWRGLASPPEEK